MTAQSRKAELLRQLHHGPGILALPNAWDCASARIFEDAGFPAIGTTSAGVAYALGYPDGQRIPRGQMLEQVNRIAACVQVPVTADLEGGYGDVAWVTSAMIDAGAVGLNLEDIDDPPNELSPIERQTDKIRTVRRIALERGVPVVINARTDVYLARIGEPSSRFDTTCQRLQSFIQAGADCLFVPGVKEEDLIRQFTQELKFPLNILAVAGSPSVQRLQDLGVARVSVGSGVMRASMGLIREIAVELKTAGTYGSMTRSAISYPDANRLFRPDST